MGKITVSVEIKQAYRPNIKIIMITEQKKHMKQEAINIGSENWH